MLLHLTEASLWRGADRVYPWSTSGLSFEQVGFVHLSGAEQVTRVAEFLYREVDGELVVLELDESALRAAGVEVRWEDGGDGEEFPHLYAPLRREWVAAVLPCGFVEGRFWWGSAGQGA